MPYRHCIKRQRNFKMFSILFGYESMSLRKAITKCQIRSGLRTVNLLLDGAEGFEPSHDGIKIR